MTPSCSRSAAEWQAELGPAAAAHRHLEKWCKTTDAIIIGRCSSCVLAKTFSASATEVRDIKEKLVVVVAAVDRHREERSELEQVVQEMQDMVREQDAMVAQEQEARFEMAKAMRANEAVVAARNADVQLAAALAADQAVAFEVTDQMGREYESMVAGEIDTLTGERDEVPPTRVRTYTSAAAAAGVKWVEAAV